MICNLLLTITIIISGPTKNNTQGTFKVTQFRFSDFTKASYFLRRYTLSMGAGRDSKSYPNTFGVDLTRTSDMKCNSEGEEYD